MTKLTHEIIEEFDLLDGESVEDWVFVVENELSNYEADITTQYVYRHRETNELWAFDRTVNSWTENYEGVRDVRIYRVEPRERMVTDYVRIKKA
jgi:hypothetical protein